MPGPVVFFGPGETLIALRCGGGDLAMIKDKPRILTITSDAALASDVSRWLSSWAEPISFETGAGDVVAGAGALEPDLVIVDTAFNGGPLGIAREIRERFSLPVILIVDDEHREELLDDDVPWCSAPKPASRSFLEPLVHYALKNHRQERGALDDFGRVAKALRESERTYYTLIRNLPGFVYRCANDRDRTLEFISEGCFEITGYNAVDFTETGAPTFGSIISTDYREGLWEKWQKALSEKKAFEEEYPIITAEGSVRWVRERGRGVFSEDGMPLFLEGFIFDVTGHRQALVDLGKARDKYRMIYENAAEGIVTYDRNMVITDANRRASEIFGYEREKVLGKTIVSLGILHPDDMGTAAKNMVRMLNKEQLGGSRYRFIRKDGSVRFCNVTGAFLCDETGEVYAVTSIVIDVTEQVLAEEALRASDERFRAIFRGAGEGILVVDGETMRFVQANPAICRFLGYTEEELMVLGVEDIHPPEALERVKREFRDKFSLDMPCLRKDGTVVYADIYNADMVIDGRDSTVGFFVDITRRKETERELVQSEEKFRSVVERSHMGIAIVNDRSEYVYVNAEFCRIAGYSPDYMLGKNFDFPLTEESRALAIDRYVRRQRGEAVPDHYEIQFIRKNGDARFGEVRSAVYRDPSGRFNSLIQVLDITDRRRAEEEKKQFEEKIRQTQKLESLGVMAGGIAHDFNNLLMAILGNIDLSLMDLPPSSPVRSNLMEAATASQRAAELCRQMLAYSGKGRFVIEAVDINSLIEEMGRMLEVSISKKSVLRYRLTRGIPAVRADATQLRQIIMNMVINGSDAIGDRSGVISITTGCIQCDRNYLDGTWLAEDIPEGYYIFIEVADTGSGMDQATMQKIFDPFFTTKFTGRGLGLAAVLGIVRGHNGAIRVYSEPGQGTTFKVLLPAAGEPEALAGTDVPCDEEWKGSGTVLLVDDEETVRALGTRMLERCGFDVLTASDGAEALELFRRHQDDIVCVLLDLTMPHMDGDETFRNLRNIKKDVRVIMSSGYNEQEVTARVAGKGHVGFIQKPYRYEELVDKLRSVLN